MSDTSNEKILIIAANRYAKYSLQYADYDMETWTVFQSLTMDKIDYLCSDGSIRKIRLELEM